LRGKSIEMYLVRYFSTRHLSKSNYKINGRF